VEDVIVFLILFLAITLLPTALLKKKISGSDFLYSSVATQY